MVMAQALEKLFMQKLSQMPQEEQIVGGKERMKKGKTEHTVNSDALWSTCVHVCACALARVCTCVHPCVRAKHK